MSRITVHIQVGECPSSQDRTFAMDLDEPLQRNVWEPLDFPSASSGFFCTTQSIVREVQRSRKLTAAELARAILEALESSDTFDGYAPVGKVFGHKGMRVHN